MKTFGIKFLESYLAQSIDEQSDYSNHRMKYTRIYDDLFGSPSMSTEDIVDKCYLDEYLLFDSSGYVYALVTIDEENSELFLHPLFIDDIAFVWPLKGIGTFEYSAMVGELGELATTEIIKLDLPEEDLELLNRIPTIEPCDIIPLFAYDTWYTRMERLINSEILEEPHDATLIKGLLNRNDTQDYGLPSVFQAVKLERKIKLKRLNNHYSSAKLKAWEQVAKHSFEFKTIVESSNLKYLKEKGD